MYHLCMLLLNHTAYSQDPKIPAHRLTTDGGECGSQTGPSEGSQPKYYQQESAMASSDPDVIKIDQQSSLSELDPSEDPNENFLSVPLENGEQITKKGN